MAGGFWQAEAGGGGVRVRVKVQPRARRDALLGLVEAADGRPRLRLATTAAPEDGRANRAACALLAGALGLAPSSVQLVLGASVREKVLAVAGDPALLGPLLETLA